MDNTNVKKYSKQVNNAIDDFDTFPSKSRVIQPVFKKSSSLSNLLFSQRS